eukprot:92428-Chlamydomonas_euryale.AAC.3
MPRIGAGCMGLEWRFLALAAASPSRSNSLRLLLRCASFARRFCSSAPDAAAPASDAARKADLRRPAVAPPAHPAHACCALRAAAVDAPPAAGRSPDRLRGLTAWRGCTSAAARASSAQPRYIFGWEVVEVERCCCCCELVVRALPVECTVGLFGGVRFVWLCMGGVPSLGFCAQQRAALLENVCDALLGDAI